MQPVSRSGPRPMIPRDDDRSTANAVLNQVLQLSSSVANELEAIAHRHADQAPVSSRHVLALRVAICAAVIEWIEGWPS